MLECSKYKILSKWNIWNAERARWRFHFSNDLVVLRSCAP